MHPEIKAYWLAQPGRMQNTVVFWDFLYDDGRWVWACFDASTLRYKFDNNDLKYYTEEEARKMIKIKAFW